MKILLESYRDNRILELDVNPNSVIDTEDKEKQLFGLFDTINNKVFALYVLDSKLFIYYDFKSNEVTQDISITYVENNNSSVLTIVNQNKEFQEVYKTPIAVDLLSHFISEEDQNFGLWLSDLINSNERKMRFIDHWSHNV